ncbi:MAG: hypothetical protein AAFU79_26740, partial [Myxococcota bacterium]
MVTTVDTWTTDTSRALPNTTQPDQYQASGFQLLQDFLAAGWSVILSGNGTNAGTGNNIGSAADFVFGSDGSQPIAYFVVQCPTAFS